MVVPIQGEVIHQTRTDKYALLEVSGNTEPDVRGRQAN